MKVLFRYDAGPRLCAEVAKLTEQGLDVVCCPEGSEQPFNTELADAEVLWHVLQPVTEVVIARALRLKLIQKIGVGVNTIDLQAAKARGIAVCNMPGANSRAVAEMTLLLMLSTLRKQSRIEGICRTGQWHIDQITKESFGEVHGRTVGFVGFGAVPKILAPILVAMGAGILYTATKQQNNDYKFVSLDTVLQEADILSLHIPLTNETEKLINTDRLALMKHGAILINTARGALVDEQALYAALNSGAVSAAGLDVFGQEPVPANNPLLSLDNVSVSPHVAWLTNETLGRSINIAVQNSISIGNGSELIHRVI